VSTESPSLPTIEGLGQLCSLPQQQGSERNADRKVRAQVHSGRIESLENARVRDFLPRNALWHKARY